MASGRSCCTSGARRDHDRLHAAERRAAEAAGRGHPLRLPLLPEVLLDALAAGTAADRGAIARHLYAEWLAGDAVRRVDAEASDEKLRGPVLYLRSVAAADPSFHGVPVNRTAAEWSAVVALVLWVIRECAR